MCLTGEHFEPRGLEELRRLNDYILIGHDQRNSCLTRQTRRGEQERALTV
jgi:hypothetical protein